MKNVEGKVAVVTGGASGVGLGMVRVFLQAGMRVAVTDIRADFLASAASELEGHGSAVQFFSMDVTNRPQVAQVADQIESFFGSVDVLCNNAGVSSWLPVDVATFEDWDWMLGVNLGGVVNCVVTFLPKLMKNPEGGHIVNTASMAGLTPLPSWGTIYTTSKFAVRGLSDSLRLAMGPHGIGVTCLCPGLTRSNIRQSERTRPKDLASTTALSSPQTSIAEVGMDPVELGAAVLRAIRCNDAYVLAHAENRPGAVAEFEEVLSYFATEPVTDEGRLQFMARFDENIRNAKALQTRAPHAD
ncbi:MAG TPA: SDR family NAD(P)-dependent oxidoreductase [Ramlibacter sp.]